MCEKFPEETGVGEEETAKLRAQREKDEQEKAEKAAVEGEADKAVVVPATRGGARPTPAGKPSTSATPYDTSEDPLSPTLLDVEGIVRTEGLAVYKDQAGRLWTGLATYWIKRGEFALARQTFEEGISTVVTLRDFTQIFDAYAEFSESYISSLMEGLADADEEDVEDDEKEMDARMKDFEELMDRRPFLVNEVLLRRNPNDVQEWEKRVALFGNDDEKVSRRCSSFPSFDGDPPSFPPPLDTGRRDLHHRHQDDRSPQGDFPVPHPLDPLCQVLRARRRFGRGRGRPSQREEDF